MPTSVLDLPEPLHAYLADWNAAGACWDWEALAACFTVDGLFYGGRPEHAVGREAIRAYFRSYVGVITACRLTMREQQAIDLGDAGLALQGWGDFSFVLDDGERTGSTVRTTLLLVRDGPRWRAKLQHFAPAPETPPLGRPIGVRHGQPQAALDLASRHVRTPGQP